MSNKFIFTEIKDHDTAKIGDDWYKLDLINGQILYKIQYNLMEENSDMELQPAKYNKEQKYEIEFEPDVKEMIAKEGIDKNFGARPLRRTIQNLVEDKLAEEILDGKLEKGKVNKITVRQLRVN